jgi:hypothetical protein
MLDDYFVLWFIIYRNLTVQLQNGIKINFENIDTVKKRVKS